MEEPILDTTLEEPIDPDVLPSGTMLCGGKYRIKSKIAQGGFGITYLADMNIGGNITRKVAVKELFLSDGHYRSDDGTTVCTINGKKIDFARWKKKFKRETEVMCSVDDVSIVKVIDYFEENATAYYSMELIDGCNVDSYVPASGLSEDNAIQLIKKVAHALNVLHSHNILHLDLNPRNIMRRNDGSVVLIDFGLSKVFDEDHNLKKTVSVTIGGAFPGFAPLEQEDYEGAFTPTIDIYALGANFYKMLTGEKPPKPTKLMNGLQVLKDKMKSKGVSNKTIGIVAKAMQFYPENRYQTVDEFLSALGQASNTNHQTKQTNTQRIAASRTQVASSYSNDDGATIRDDNDTQRTAAASSYSNDETKASDSKENTSSDSEKEESGLIVSFFFVLLMAGMFFWGFKTSADKFVRAVCGFFLISNLLIIFIGLIRVLIDKFKKK